MVRLSTAAFIACTATGVAQSTEKVIVRFKATTHAPLAALAPHERTRQGVRNVLGSHAGSSQASVQQMLTERNIEFKSFWIENALVATGVPQAVLDELRLHDDVISVDKDRVIHLDPVVPEGEPNGDDSSMQGNIAELNTAALWAAGYQGQGVTVASIDSGVRWTHESLIDNYRGRNANRTSTVDHDYAFWDSSGLALTPENADVFGHGSHTMGTIAGGGPKGIGMAPKAEWIHAKAFNWAGASEESGLIAAQQWVLCPTKYDSTGEDCSKGADIVSCSFGGAPTADDPMTWLNPGVDAWRAAGVLGVFAAGNVKNNMQCGSVMESAGYDKAIAIGGVNNGALYGASGKGPGLDGKSIKPDFVCPYKGINSICSAADSGRSGYMRLTGTSMATPHAAGAFALLLSAVREQKIDVAPEDLLEALRNTAVQDVKKPKLAASVCGGTPWNEFPNNIYGWGEPDVCAAAASLGVACNSASIV